MKYIPGKLAKQSQTHIKLNNLKLVLSTIINSGPLSRADIVRLTKISKPTASSLVHDLIRRNLIYEIGKGNSKTGKKPILVDFNSKLKYFIAFEIGRSAYRCAISDLRGDILNRYECDFDLDTNIQTKLEILKDSILELLKSSRISRKAILKIICIAPGVYAEEGKGLKWFPFAGENEDIDIACFFKDEFHTNSLLQHSTKLSLLGEKIAGKARNYENVVYIDFAYGIGCALMINGEIFYGANNSAGEIGYFYSSIEEFTNHHITSFDFGALEGHISGKSIQAKAKESIRSDGNTRILDLADRKSDKISAKTIFDAAILGDNLGLSILKESFQYFNMALCNVINLITPELVIFGGGFSKAGDFLLSLISSEIQEKVLISPKLEISDLKNQAAIIGGIHYLITQTDFLHELD